MRGQAHVVFRNISDATSALKALQGFKLYDKEMNIAYGRGKSDIIKKLDGTYQLFNPTAAVAPEDAVAGQKRVRAEEGMKIDIL